MERHTEAVKYALQAMKKSNLAPYIRNVYLYGSVARGQEQWDSDIDLFIVLDESAREMERLTMNINCLKADMTLPGLYDVLPDAHFTIGDNWRNSKMLYHENIRRDGIELWQ